MGPQIPAGGIPGEGMLYVNTPSGTDSDATWIESQYYFTDELLIALEKAGKSLPEIASIIIPFGEKDPLAIIVDGVEYYNDNDPSHWADKYVRIKEVLEACYADHENIAKSLLDAEAKKKSAEAEKERASQAYDETERERKVIEARKHTIGRRNKWLSSEAKSRFRLSVTKKNNEYESRKRGREIEMEMKQIEMEVEMEEKKIDMKAASTAGAVCHESEIGPSRKKIRTSHGIYELREGNVVQYEKDQKGVKTEDIDKQIKREPDLEASDMAALQEPRKDRSCSSESNQYVVAIESQPSQPHILHPQQPLDFPAPQSPAVLTPASMAIIDSQLEEASDIIMEDSVSKSPITLVYEADTMAEMDKQASLAPEATNVDEAASFTEKDPRKDTESTASPIVVKQDLAMTQPAKFEDSSEQETCGNDDSQVLVGLRAASDTLEGSPSSEVAEIVFGQIHGGEYTPRSGSSSPWSTHSGDSPSHTEMTVGEIELREQEYQEGEAVQNPTSEEAKHNNENGGKIVDSFQSFPEIETDVDSHSASVGEAEMETEQVELAPQTITTPTETSKPLTDTTVITDGDTTNTGLLEATLPTSGPGEEVEVLAPQSVVVEQSRVADPTAAATTRRRSLRRGSVWGRR